MGEKECTKFYFEHFFYFDLFLKYQHFVALKVHISEMRAEIENLRLLYHYNFILLNLVCLSNLFYAIWTFGFWPLAQKSHFSFFLGHPLGPQHYELRGALKKNCIFYDIWQKGRGSKDQNQISEEKKFSGFCWFVGWYLPNNDDAVN